MMINIIDDFIEENYFYKRLFYSQKLCALIQKSRYSTPEIVVINPNFDYNETFNYSYNFAGACCTDSTNVSNIIKLGTREELLSDLKVYSELNSKIEEIKNSFQ